MNTHATPLPAYLPRAIAAALVVLALAAAGARAAEDEETPVVHPSGIVILNDPAGQMALPISKPPRGTVFALAPIAARLGVELRVGPLNDSHTLLLGDRTAIAGPESPLVVITEPGGGEQLITLSQHPLKTIEGLKVPLDFLERTIGDSLGWDFRWDQAAGRLDVVRRQLRQLEGQLLRLRQGRVTTVQVTFSAAPRYRVERLADGLEIQLIGDRLTLTEQRGEEQDPLVRGVEALDDRLRIRLAEDAAATDPRLLDDPPRLVVEVFRRSAPRGEAAAPAPPVANASSGRLRTIVLDPGHGGSETGAIGRSGAAEKDLALLLARALRRRLQARLPVRVLLTRGDDAELPLDSRTAFANQQKADLFISLHLNSVFGASAHGAETYFLSREASDQLAARAADFENSAEAAADPEMDLKLILWDLAQSLHLAESQRFANIVQEELNQALGLRDRGVKQAPFRVLMGANMPAVLVELGFLSNPEEEGKLQDPAYRAQLVSALVRAIVRFKMLIEAREGLPAEGMP